MSMPRPSRSNFTRPAAAQSSLSHWSTERFSMRAHSTGQHSMSGRSAITIPPEWMPEVAREVEHLLGEVERQLRDRRPPSSLQARRTTAVACSTARHRSIHLVSASAWPGERPTAFAISRSAERGR